MASARRAFCTWFWYRGRATAASMAMMARVIISSSRVKPAMAERCPVGLCAVSSTGFPPLVQAGGQGQVAPGQAGVALAARTQAIAAEPAARARADAPEAAIGGA